ncbi:putative ankyrin repeat protein [Rosellinia necatrix]|uniref:Putative ankyrin repeat protein n=1 Tax=Rosellinia necatrix TaxID=77044 RepID=A0A1W2TS70_ROSNE|nr:putative ankyrin repeat protein [Rosellinia necatrix]
MEARGDAHPGDGAEGRETGRDPRYSDVSVMTDPGMGESDRGSGSHWGSEPGFEHIDGEIEGLGYNETTVDIIAVPCLGASPVDTWARDPLDEGYFTFPPVTEMDKYATAKDLPASSVQPPTINRVLPTASHVWIRQGIRKEASNARVLLYRHRELSEGMTIEKAADDLIEQLSIMRKDLKKARPMFFICHSIGGLVVKAALVKARQRRELKPLVFDCHGITFFATPHRGSSYLSMPSLRESIQNLLFLQSPLPRSITDELRLWYKPLLKLHDEFTDVASDLRLWTFYETVDSQLSGLGSGGDSDEVHFSAPITSIKSGLVGSRTEQALSLESDHAHCASFGRQNLHIMHSYLYDLGEAVRKAELLSSTYVHTPLRLSNEVKVELIGFYDDPDGEAESIRLYVSKHYLAEFLAKGPEQCLRARLETMAPKRRKATFPLSQRVASSVSTASRAASILTNVQELGQRILGSSRSSSRSRSPGRDIPLQSSPEIVVTSHTPRRPSLAGGTSEPLPNVNVTPARSRGLTVPTLTGPKSSQLPERKSSESVGSSIDEVASISSQHIIADVSPTTVEGRKTQDDGQATHNEKEGADPARPRRGRTHRTESFQDYKAGFSRPDPDKRKFMWIHLPFNNPHWVKTVFDKVSESQNRSYSKLLSNDYWASKHVQGRRANWHVSYVKPGCAFVPAETGIPRSPPPNKSGRSSSPNVSPSHFYLYLPYLHYDTYVNIVRRREIIKRRQKHGRARPVPKEIADLESLESRVIWEFIGYDHPLNARRTLDQYGYPALQDTWARDDDQMLYKLTKQRMVDPLKRKRDMYHNAEGPTSAVSPASWFASVAEKVLDTTDTSGSEEDKKDPGRDIINGNALMVDQLWLWAVDNTTLMTFFPKRESHPIEGPLFQQADLRNSIYNELNGDLTGRCENALDLAAFITLHAVTVLLDRTAHPDLEVFRIFEEAIGILTERMTSSLKQFRTQSHGEIHSDYHSGSDDPDDNRTEAIKKRHQRELRRAERQNREHTSAVLELRDMEDELHTLLSLFGEQQGAVGSMKRSYEESELREDTKFGREYLKEALRRLEEYDKQARDMLTRVDATRKDYEKLQEMIQRQAQVDEVRWSRLQAELASSQNLSVMIFTTFTVIFLPLSFFTSLFGMNTQEWGGPDENEFPSLRLIGAISLPGSALLIAFTLVAAFSGRAQGLIRASYRGLRASASLCAAPFRAASAQLARLEASSRSAEAAARKRRRARARELGREADRARRRRDRGYDFWGAVRAERHATFYEIPETNRRPPRRFDGGGGAGAGAGAGDGNGTGAGGVGYRGTWSRIRG